MPTWATECGDFTKKHKRSITYTTMGNLSVTVETNEIVAWLVRGGMYWVHGGMY